MRSTRRKPASSTIQTGVHPTPTDAAGASSGRDSKPCCSRPSGPVQCTVRWCWMLQIRPSEACCHSSLNVNVSRQRGGASPSRSCALVMNCGAGTMQEDHTISLLKSQGSSRSCRQDTALGVHYGRNVVVAWKRSPVAVPGRDRRFRQSHPTVSCSPCHVHHKSVGGRLLKTRPWPATRKRYNLSHPRLHQPFSGERTRRRVRVRAWRLRLRQAKA